MSALPERLQVSSLIPKFKLNDYLINQNMASEANADLVPNEPLHLLNIDWSKLRQIDRTVPPIISPQLPNPDIIQLIRWLWAAEAATKEKRSANAWLGNQISANLAEFQAGSFFTDYQNGTIWVIGEKPQITWTFIVLGAIRDRYRAIGQASSGLGHPTSDEDVILDGRGRYQRFSNGEMYWSPTTGAFEVYGDIFAYYASFGKVGSWLGYPLTGELPTPNGRMNSFEHGQITWRASDRDIEAATYRDKILAKYNSIGGINSRLGLPATANIDTFRSGNAFMSSFRGGNTTIPLDQPTAAGVQTLQVEVWFRGLECQVRQEGSDEIFGSIGCFVPSTIAVRHERFGRFDMGSDNQRIAPFDFLLYSGPPALLYISTGLRESDPSPFGIPTGGTGDQPLYESAKDSVSRFGAPSDPSPASAVARETIVHPARYAIWFQAKYFENWNSLAEQDFDLYPPGFMSISEGELHSQPAVHRTLRADDPKSLHYTHSVSVTAKDDEDDTGVYAFYFEVKVSNVQNVI